MVMDEDHPQSGSRKKQRLRNINFPGCFFAYLESNMSFSMCFAIGCQAFGYCLDLGEEK